MTHFCVIYIVRLGSFFLCLEDGVVCKHILRDWIQIVLDSICWHANEQLTKTPIFIPRKEIREFPWGALASCTSLTKITSKFSESSAQLSWQYHKAKNPILELCDRKDSDTTIHIFTQNRPKGQSFAIKVEPNTKIQVVFLVCPMKRINIQTARQTQAMNTQPPVQTSSTTPPGPTPQTAAALCPPEPSQTEEHQTLENFVTNHVKESQAHGMWTVLLRMDSMRIFHQMQTITLHNDEFTATKVVFSDLPTSSKDRVKTLRTCSDQTKVRLKEILSAKDSRVLNVSSRSLPHLQDTKNTNTSQETTSEPEVVTISEDDVNTSSTVTEQIRPSTSSHDFEKILAREDEKKNKEVDQPPNTDDNKESSEESSHDLEKILTREDEKKNKEVDQPHQTDDNKESSEEVPDKRDPKPVTPEEVSVEKKIENSIYTDISADGEDSQDEESFTSPSDPLKTVTEEKLVEELIKQTTATHLNTKQNGNSTDVAPGIGLEEGTDHHNETESDHLPQKQSTDLKVPEQQKSNEVGTEYLPQETNTTHFQTTINPSYSTAPPMLTDPMTDSAYTNSV